MSGEPDILVLQLLREIRAEQAQTNNRIDRLGRAAAADLHEYGGMIGTQIDLLRKDLSGQIAGLRRALVEYHSAVIGHGSIITDPEGH